MKGRRDEEEEDENDERSNLLGKEARNYSRAMGSSTAASLLSHSSDTLKQSKRTLHETIDIAQSISSMLEEDNEKIASIRNKVLSTTSGVNESSKILEKMEWEEKRRVILVNMCIAASIVIFLWFLHRLIF